MKGSGRHYAEKKKEKGYRLPAMPWSWLGAAAPSAAAAAAVAAAAVTPSPAAAPLVLAPRAAARRSVYYDPFLAAHAATQDPNYRLQATVYRGGYNRFTPY